MKITEKLFEAYLKCPLKCFLLSVNEMATANVYAEWTRDNNVSFRNTQVKRLAEEAVPNDCITSPQGIENVMAAKWRIALDVTIREKNLESNIHAVKKIPPRGRGQPVLFIPVRFIARNKITKDDRLLLAFDAHVLSERLGHRIGRGQLIHGDNKTTVTVNTGDLLNKVRQVTDRIANLLSTDSPPDLMLNRRCAECEFQTTCNLKAKEKDDLSLLSSMSEKERKNFNKKGVFTVTQLSYMFRPRRKSKRATDKREKYHNSLKALAIREGKIHVVGSGELKVEGTPVYLDVEGIPDRDFYYLIGVRVGSAQAPIQHSLWADTQDDEKRIWSQFLDILSVIDNPLIIHYGSFETAFLKHMCNRHGGPAEGSIAARAVNTPLNLLSFIFSRIYFPTYSNGLKDVGRYLGFNWSEPGASGIKTIVWRSEWEKSHEMSLQQKLITYNAEDCTALSYTTEFLSEIAAAKNDETGNRKNIVHADSLPRRGLFKWGKTHYLLSALEEINRTAYWDYHREKIILRSNKQLKKIARETTRKTKLKYRANSVVEWPAPDACIRCGRLKIYRHYKYTKEIVDIKFGRSSIKRWVTRYISYYYRCPVCGAVFYNADRPWDRDRYGRNLLLLSAYLNIDLRMSQKRVAVFLKQVLGFNFSDNVVNHFKTKVASLYRPTFDSLLKKIVNGNLIHADETPINLNGKKGYVWALASLEDVVFIYAPSREGNLVKTLLRDFKGVLITDFYTAYESINCLHQKCLLHLVRDLNDELMKEPFNQEIKTLVTDFANLLKPMVETVDRHGLKAHFLQKHKSDVERFFRNLSRHSYKTEIAAKCKKRFEKNRHELFTFLDHDGVPWNNNNAEHAIKAVARLRRNLDGQSTEKGICDYLILLSICETCRFKGLSFLNFLRSGEKDLDIYVNGRTWRGKEYDTRLVPCTKSGAILG